MGNKIKVVLTEDIIKLVKFFKIEEFSGSRIGFDTYALYPESQLFDFMAMVLGLQDKRIPDTIYNPMGSSYDKETTEKLMEIDGYIVENLTFIEEILHQFCDVGIKPGTYTCLANNRIWKYVGLDSK